MLGAAGHKAPASCPRGDGQWPGRRRLSSRSASVWKSTAICRLRS